MTPGKIKVGDKINIEAIVIRKLHSEEQLITCELQLPIKQQFHIWQRDFEALSPATDIKNAEPAPKYDPCRKFRKGDKVRLVEYKGRHFNTDAKRMWFCTGIVTFSECEHEYIDVCVSFGNSEEDIEIDPAYLELVKPVEEMEPYSVHESDENYFWIHSAKENPLDHRLSFNYHYRGEFNKNDAIFTREEAKEAAEAERDRLNAEYRKEQNNG